MRPARATTSEFNAQTTTILIGASVMLSLAMGMRQSFGLFLGPISRDLAITAADFTFAIAIQNIVWGITQPFMGALADRYGCRPVALLGVVIYAAGLAVMWNAVGTLSLTLGAGVLVGLAMSCTASNMAMAASARAVSAGKRSLVLGIVSGAGSMGTFFAAPMAQTLIAGYGWGAAMLGFLGLAVVMAPMAYLAGGADKLGGGRAGADENSTFKGILTEAAHHGGYIIMASAFFVCGLQLVFLTTHLPTYLEICGLDPMLSAQALATVGAFNVLGSYLLGWLGGRYPKHLLLGGVYILRSLALAVFFIVPASPASTLLFSAVMGTLWLGVVPLVNGLVAQIFGLRYMATLTGIAFFSHQVGSFLGAWGGGLLYDTLGNYDRAIQTGVAIGIIAGLAQMFMNDKPTPRMEAARAAAE